jgi:(p)ppGpp synthase/HD superfamily hydrolase
MLKENEIAKLVVDAAYHVHTKLGPGLLESVYEKESFGLLTILKNEIK